MNMRGKLFFFIAIFFIWLETKISCSVCIKYQIFDTKQYYNLISFVPHCWMQPYTCSRCIAASAHAVSLQTDTLRKLCFHFLSHWMGYDRGESFLSILNQMKFHLVQNRKENCHHDYIPFNVKVKYIFFSVHWVIPPHDFSFSTGS